MSKFIDKLAYIYTKDQKVLMSLTRGKDTWYIPGGKREDGESDQEALMREVQEELSVDLIESTIKPYGVFEAQAHGKAEGIIVRMTCYTADFEGELKANEEIDKIDFFGFERIDETGPVDHIIFNDLRSKELIA